MPYLAYCKFYVLWTRVYAISLYRYDMCNSGVMLAGRSQRQQVPYQTTLRPVGGVPVQTRQLPGSGVRYPRAGRAHFFVGWGEIPLAR